MSVDQRNYGSYSGDDDFTKVVGERISRAFFSVENFDVDGCFLDSAGYPVYDIDQDPSERGDIKYFLFNVKVDAAKIENEITEPPMSVQFALKLPQTCLYVPNAADRPVPAGAVDNAEPAPGRPRRALDFVSLTPKMTESLR
ncbi:MAG: hypothetical protein ACREOZ_04655, partial [Gloeomargaritales cyanobacterium]